MKKSKLNQVGNFGKAVSFVNAQGAVYNPSNASIQVAALDALLTQTQGSVKAADVSRTAYEQAINKRQAVFRDIPKLSRRIIAAMKANGASPDALEDVMTIKRRLSSQKAKPAGATSLAVISADGNSQEVKMKRRLSQLDLDSKIGNFQRMVIKATSLPSYKPNEADLQAQALSNFVTGLKHTNDAVITAYIAMKDADQFVDNLLYGKDGIHETSITMKSYIESVFGFRSEKHREISKLKFRNK